jgi:hypothetical protein
VGLLPPTDLRSLFAAFRHTAWRLESRDAYAVDVEAEPFRRWQAGETPDQTYRSGWMTTVRGAVGQGKRIERVRVVPEPLTDYLRFEAWLGKQNTEAGEDIRYLDRERAQTLGIPSYNHDYWLFDSHLLYRMHFDEDDHLLGLTLVDDPSEVVRANHYHDAARQYATPFPAWYANHEHECEPQQRQART